MASEPEESSEWEDTITLKEIYEMNIMPELESSDLTGTKMRDLGKVKARGRKSYSPEEALLLRSFFNPRDENSLNDVSVDAIKNIESRVSIIEKILLRQKNLTKKDKIMKEKFNNNRRTGIEFIDELIEMSEDCRGIIDEAKVRVKKSELFTEYHEKKLKI